jgi:two-component system, cell cycle response regulator
MDRAMCPAERQGACLAAAADFEATQPLPPVNPCRVLIVDDDDLVRARLSALLTASNYDIEVAASGEEALRVMGATHCHIVLTDWEMPDMDGLALCRCVRISQEERYIYVLMLTVRDSKSDVLEGLAAGADDYIVKGSPTHEILARLEVGRRIVQQERALRANRTTLRLSLTDGLTGAHNLRYFARELSRELARSKRYRHPLAVLRCDIDEFAHIRNRLGHESAAAILRAFVTRSEGCIRASSDWIARVGLGEFMIVLPETTIQGAHRVARKLHEVIGTESVATPLGAVPLKAVITTISAEPNKRPDSALPIEELIRTARRGIAKRGIGQAQLAQEAGALPGSALGTPGSNQIN